MHDYASITARHTLTAIIAIPYTQPMAARASITIVITGIQSRTGYHRSAGAAR
jgi:hypothetical protein